MKKKFVLTLALVLMVAAAVVAAPLEVSGDFYAGYIFKFDPFNADSARDSAEGEIYNVTFSGDFWDVEFSDLKFTDSQDTGATATVYLDKALAAEGVDMGDVSLKFAIGNMTTMKPTDVYSDSNDAVGELEMNGDYSSKVTVGYTDMVTVEFAADPTTADKPILLGVKAVPVDGVSAAFGYTNFGKVRVDDNGTSTVTTDDVTVTSAGITGSVAVDVAALAGLDFGMTVSALDVYYFEDSLTTDPVNRLYVEANGSYEDIAAWVEYQNIEKKNNVIAKVTYSGIENVGVYAQLNLENDFKDTTIGAGADYTLGGVTYALDGSYEIKGQFSLTPSVSISF